MSSTPLGRARILGHARLAIRRIDQQLHSWELEAKKRTLWLNCRRTTRSPVLSMKVLMRLIWFKCLRGTSNNKRRAIRSAIGTCRRLSLVQSARRLLVSKASMSRSRALPKQTVRSSKPSLFQWSRVQRPCKPSRSSYNSNSCNSNNSRYQPFDRSVPPNWIEA